MQREVRPRDLEQVPHGIEGESERSVTLGAAIRKAEIVGVSQVYQLSRPTILRGIKTEFTPEDHTEIDWQICRRPEWTFGHSGDE